MKQSGEIEINLTWTDRMDERTKQDFIDVQKEVFESEFDEHGFQHKFMNNIYGPSIIITAYRDGKCVGAQAFQRNDVGGEMAYQSCNTAVVGGHRGMGIFGKMVAAGLNQMSDNAFAYGFPNDNSYKGFIKQGWNLCSTKRYRLFRPVRDKLLVDNIPEDYLSWLLDKPSPTLFYARIKSSYYLLKQRKANLYLVVGQIEKENTKLLNRALFPVCLAYSKDGYAGRGLVTIAINSRENLEIPVYKLDTLF